MEIRAVTIQEEIAFSGYHDETYRDLFGAFVDGRLIAISGVQRDPRYHGSIFEEDGRWIGSFEVREDSAQFGIKAMLAMRTYLAKQTEDIMVLHDDSFPKAERLLRLLGFQPTEKFQADYRQPTRKLRIWLWQQRRRSRA